jgi:hypothetical protein
MVETAVLQTLLVNGPIGVLWLIFAVKILKRGPSKRINQMFFLFLGLTAIGMFVNVAYRLIGDEFWNIVLNQVVIYLSTVSIVFLLIFNLIILKSDKIITDKIKFVLIIAWSIISSGYFFIEGGVEWIYPSGVAGVPHWSPVFAIFGIIIGQTLWSATLIVVIQIYRRFEDQKLRRKYINTIVAIAIFDWILIGNCINNMINEPTFSTIFLITSILVIPAGILLYMGVKRDT